jgi:hypothetical protein
LEFQAPHIPGRSHILRDILFYAFVGVAYKNISKRYTFVLMKENMEGLDVQARESGRREVIRERDTIRVSSN